MQSPFIQLTPAQSNKKSLVLAAVGVIAVVGVIYACFGASTVDANGFSTLVIPFVHSHAPIPNHIVLAFHKWAAHHNKTYLSATESSHRLNVFYENFKAIKEHMDKGSDVKLALNKFADMNRTEFKARYLSLDQRAVNRTRALNITFLNTSNNSDSVDWRNKSAVTGVKDQKQCGSCWAFSATGALEGAYVAAKKGQLPSFAEQELVDCSWDYGNEGCNGGLMDQAFQYVQEKGIAAESDYKYTARDGDCKKDIKRAVQEKELKGFTDVPPNDEDQLSAAIVKTPVAVAIEADSLVFQFYSSGVIDSKSCGTDLDHGVLAVGYDIDPKSQKLHYIVKNSWGTGWGDNGYVKILRQPGGKSAGICGIAEMASYAEF